ncbi:MAG: efflux RND transporter periplasmic adaptor subunit [Candidatus Tectomicrobia bacterium]|nr:efflux RND transporter periplasmic adaptor subunit [Candidatus Tectomicrobia bacterium]
MKKAIGWLFVLGLIGGGGWFIYNSLNIAISWSPFEVKIASKNSAVPQQGAAARAQGGPQGGGQGGARRVPVNTVTARIGTIDEKIPLTGDVLAQSQVQLLSQISGIIEKITVDRGDRVKAGQVIAKIDDREFVSQVKQAQAALDMARAKWEQVQSGARPEEIGAVEEQVRQARANYENAKANLERVKQLFDQKLTSQSQFDEAQTRYTTSLAAYTSTQGNLKLIKEGARKEDRDSVLAQVRQAEANLELAQTRLKNTTFTAPFDGVIGTRYIDLGALVSPNRPLVDIINIDEVKVIARIVEREVGKIKSGNLAELSVDPYPGRTFTGQVSKMSPTVDPNTRTAEIEIIVSNSDYLLKPGMFARLNVILRRHEGVLLIPKKAIIERSGLLSFFTVQSGNDGVSTAILNPLKKGLENDDWVEVQDQIKVGDQVVIAGQVNLRNGVPISVITVDGKSPERGGANVEREGAPKRPQGQQS